MKTFLEDSEVKAHLQQADPGHESNKHEALGDELSRHQPPYSVAADNQAQREADRHQQPGDGENNVGPGALGVLVEREEERVQMVQAPGSKGHDE